MIVFQNTRRYFLAATGMTRRKRRLLIGAYITVLIIVICYFFGFPGKWFRTNACVSEDCLALTRHIESFIDESLDPCDGFYNFVCGGFTASQTTSHKKQSVFQMLNERKDRAIRDLVTNATLTNETIVYKSLETQRRFYRLCTEFQSDRMNLKASKVLEIDIQQLLQPPWTVRSKLTRKHPWLVPMIEAKQQGAFYNFFLSLDIQTNAEGDKPTFRIGPPSLDLMRLLKPLENTHNAEKMIRIIELFGKFNVEGLLNTTQDLSNIVKEFLTNVPKFHRPQIKHMVQIELQDLHKYMRQHYKKFDIATFVEEFIRSDGLSSSTVVLVLVDLSDDKYFHFLETLVRTVPPSSWSLLAIATIILKDCPYLSGWPRRDCSQILAQVKPEPEYLKLAEDEFCFQESRHYFPKVAEAAYIRNMLTTEKVPRVLNIISEVWWQIQAGIQLRSDIPKRLLDEFESRIARINYIVGWNNKNFDERFAELFLNYWKIESNSNDILEMRRHFDKALLLKQVQEAILLMNGETPLSYGHQMSARPDVFFDINRLNFNVLAPLLTDPIMTSSNETRFLEYATVGSMVGKVLVNTINKLVKFSDYSALKEHMWVFMEDQQNCIGRKAKAFLTAKSYTKIPTEDPAALETFNARLLADVIGTQAAYKAFEASSSINDELNLPGLNYTGRELFWIMASTYMCRSMNEYIDVPSTSFQHNEYTVQYQIEIPILNSNQFDKDFKCNGSQYSTLFEKCEELFVDL